MAKLYVASKTELDTTNLNVSELETNISDSSWRIAALVQFKDAQTIARQLVYDMGEVYGALYVEKVANQGLNVVFKKTDSTDTYGHGVVVVARNDLGTATMISSADIEHSVISRNYYLTSNENTLISDLKNYNSASIDLQFNREWDEADLSITERPEAYVYSFRLSRAYGGQTEYDDRIAIYAKREKVIVNNDHLKIVAV